MHTNSEKQSSGERSSIFTRITAAIKDFFLKPFGVRKNAHPDPQDLLVIAIESFSEAYDDLQAFREALRFGSGDSTRQTGNDSSNQERLKPFTVESLSHYLDVMCNLSSAFKILCNALETVIREGLSTPASRLYYRSSCDAFSSAVSSFTLSSYEAAEDAAYGRLKSIEKSWQATLYEAGPASAEKTARAKEYREKAAIEELDSEALDKIVDVVRTLGRALEETAVAATTRAEKLLD